ncbi:MAG TPA: hypothetical protein ENK86_06675 [Campylobacterales bacterium]|nr:hypothetical protein [Campylobacterales bacterium]
MRRWMISVVMGMVMGYGAESNTTQPTVKKAATKMVIGRLEQVRVMEVGIAKKARIDTGAKTTSIDAHEIQLFERDGQAWVRFTFEDEPIEKPVVRTVLIKRHGGKSIRRQVVELELKLGQTVQTVEVTLANREKYTYAILIGRNFLRKRFLVDVSRVFMGCSNTSIPVF